MKDEYVRQFDRSDDSMPYPYSKYDIDEIMKTSGGINGYDADLTDKLITIDFNKTNADELLQDNQRLVFWSRSLKKSISNLSVWVHMNHLDSHKSQNHVAMNVQILFRKFYIREYQREFDIEDLLIYCYKTRIYEYYSKFWKDITDILLSDLSHSEKRPLLYVYRSYHYSVNTFEQFVKRAVEMSQNMIKNRNSTIKAIDKELSNCLSLDDKIEFLNSRFSSYNLEEDRQFRAYLKNKIKDVKLSVQCVELEVKEDVLIE